ncbi:GAF domain-containing protein [Ottowia sp. GY511]|uniref:GAF domain-containing protein n=1 Tax=Ottowia flava TaxID=2675430 RepID=A0ABW4KVC8_9BURK|nr:GAF domain-containing protein [Ottowia sp. GY511]TXK33322.1 GAF domain-containing protein [Ottowia sp. GY511]
MLRRTPVEVGRGTPAPIGDAETQLFAPAPPAPRGAAGAWEPTVLLADLADGADGARDESERRSLALLQARGMSALQYVAETAARICETPIAAVSMMDGEAVWFQAIVGAELKKLARDASFCTHAVGGMPDVLVVPDARADARFNRLALVNEPPCIRFYAGAPFMTAGAVSMGAVSVADTVPRDLTPVQVRTLELLARQTVMLLDARMRNEEVPAR